MADLAHKEPRFPKEVGYNGARTVSEYVKGDVVGNIVLLCENMYSF
jgi:hypothetical protein